MKKGRHSRREAPKVRELPVPGTSRQAALSVLHAYASGGETFATERLGREFRRVDLTPSDRRLATELVHGVVRRRRTLDALLRLHVKRPREQVENELWTILQLGAYQLVFLGGVPAHAAVHETVELTRWLNQPRWSGFANGVLRSILRGLTDEIVNERAGNAIPLAAGRYRTFGLPIFPEPAQDELGYLGQAFSFPDWLIGRWRSRYSLEETVELAFWFDAPPPLSLRTNTLRTTREKLLGALGETGIACHPAAHPELILLDESIRIEELPGFADGWFVVQDQTAAAASVLLAPQSGEMVLDLCAAPGTKTTHMAALMRNTGRILATDVSRERLTLVEENCRRLGVEIIEPMLISLDGSDIPPGPFDAILIDVPCSNTGVLNKRPEARWRIRPCDIEELAVVQRNLLDAAAARLRDGGRIVYSTCSIEPEENQQVVASFLAEHAAFRVAEEREHRPGHPADGGYQALLQHTASVSANP